MTHSRLGVVAVAAALGFGLVPAGHAHAADWALNGRYLATSNGDWATTNEVYHDQPTVRSIWTITMTCRNVVTCDGTVVSDAGWSAPIAVRSSDYYVVRDLPDWQRCADGTGRTVTGHQRYRFFPAGPDGNILPGSTVLAGTDKTSGESGACSLNQKVQIDMPFRLEKLE
jgi:hypothetical protein